MTAVSIITPAYNAEETIARAVHSVLKQTHTDWEMIIISDDGKDYKAILAKQNIADKRLRFATTGKIKSGAARGRNVGLDLADGAFITTLDADDEYHLDYLTVLVKAAKENGIAMVMLAYKITSDGTKQPLFEDGYEDRECRWVTLEDYLTINGRNVTLFDQKLLKHRYMETLTHAEDFYFDVRFFESVQKIPVFSERLYIYHYNPQSLTSIARADEEFIENYKRIITSIEADKTFPAQLKNNFLAMTYHRLFQNYLYLNAKLNGECTDFFDFMAKYPEHFKQL